ncbi:MAG: hypothetical protein ABR500_11860 [Dermatophilaceae bacterium]|nr:hypothetical protein [Intrasporangiaceae bacterium]
MRPATPARNLSTAPADYLVGERTSLALSLVGKSVLALQIFGGTLATWGRPPWVCGAPLSR